MAVQAFLSYCHEDEAGLLELRKRLATLKRQGFIKDWSDHQITAGTEIDPEVKKQLENSQLFIALVSPDYIDSGYCWDKELQIALQRQTAGNMSVLPVIYRFSDWKHTPLSQKLCIPKDGHPILSRFWFNEDEAWQNVIEKLRDVLQKLNQPKPTQVKFTPTEIKDTPQNISATSLHTLSLPKNFTDYDKQNFVQNSFKTLTAFFEKRISAIQNESPGWQGSFEQKTNDLAIVSIYLEGNLAAQASLVLTAPDNSFGFATSNTPKMPSLICYSEGALSYGKYKVSMGTFWHLNGGASSSSHDPSCILELHEGFSSLSWQKHTGAIEGFTQSQLILAERTSEEGFSAEEVADIFWNFLIKKASKIKEKDTAPYFRY
ncbi:toll/interleukin-1 receptor domain-containing protein [Acetobacteraceae bacterium]|nr:toll/interleukin-1 receptor domain-containing protein [Acetobacteraceae bacterium]